MDLLEYESDSGSESFISDGILGAGKNSVPARPPLIEVLSEEPTSKPTAPMPELLVKSTPEIVAEDGAPLLLELCGEDVLSQHSTILRLREAGLLTTFKYCEICSTNNPPVSAVSGTITGENNQLSKNIQRKEGRYTCPGCEIRFCSVECSKKHKSDTECTGKRSRTTFVAQSEYNNRTMMEDMSYLQEIYRVTNSSKRKIKDYGTMIAPRAPQRSQRGRNTSRNSRKGSETNIPRLPLARHNFLRAAREAGVILKLMPSGMLRQEQNTSKWVASKKPKNSSVEHRGKKVEKVQNEPTDKLPVSLEIVEPSSCENLSESLVSAVPDVKSSEIEVESLDGEEKNLEEADLVENSGESSSLIISPNEPSSLTSEEPNDVSEKSVCDSGTKLNQKRIIQPLSGKLFWRVEIEICPSAPNQVPFTVTLPLVPDHVPISTLLLPLFVPPDAGQLDPLASIRAEVLERLPSLKQKLSSSNSFSPNATEVKIPHCSVPILQNFMHFSRSSSDNSDNTQPVSHYTPVSLSQEAITFADDFMSTLLISTALNSFTAPSTDSTAPSSNLEVVEEGRSTSPLNPLVSLVGFMRRHPYRQNGNIVYCEVPSRSSLREGLCGAAVVEFPTFVIFDKDIQSSFPLFTPTVVSKSSRANLTGVSDSSDSESSDSDSSSSSQTSSSSSSSDSDADSVQSLTDIFRDEKTKEKSIPSPSQQRQRPRLDNHNAKRNVNNSYNNRQKFNGNQRKIRSTGSDHSNQKNNHINNQNPPLPPQPPAPPVHHQMTPQQMQQMQMQMHYMQMQMHMHNQAMGGTSAAAGNNSHSGGYNGFPSVNYGYPYQNPYPPMPPK